MRRPWPTGGCRAKKKKKKKTETKTIISFLHGIYNYTPEITHVSRLYRVAAVLDGTLGVISHVEYSVV